MVKIYPEAKCHIIISLSSLPLAKKRPLFDHLTQLTQAK